MPIKIRSGFADKWQRRAAVATQDYAAGVQDPRQSWRAATAAAAQAYRQGLQQALAQQRWERGVARVTDQEWATRAAELGGQRYAQGVEYSAGTYAQRVQPYLQTIAGLNLPPRGPRGDLRNLQRVQAVVEALVRRKAQASGAEVK